MMNTLPKSLTIAFLAVFIFISGLNVAFVGAQNTAGEKKLVVELSDEKKAWLKAHPEITLGTSTSYPPNVIKNPDGTYTGVLPNLYEQISQVLNTMISLHIGGGMGRRSEKSAKQGDRRPGHWRKGS